MNQVSPVGESSDSGSGSNNTSVRLTTSNVFHNSKATGVVFSHLALFNQIVTEG